MDPVIDYTVRLALALLFLAALVHKLRGARAFQQTVAAYRIVPAVLVPGAAVAVVAVEVLVLVLLGDGDRNRMGLTTAGCLLLAYAAAIAVNLLRGRDRIDCGCVGSAGREGLSWWLVGRNLGLAAAGGLLLVYAAAIAVNLLRGRDRIDCGCVGSAGREGLSWWLVGRNVGLATIAFAGLAPVAERPLGIVDWLTAIAATVTLAALYVAFDGLVANVPAYRRLREAT